MQLQARSIFKEHFLSAVVVRWNKRRRKLCMTLPDPIMYVDVGKAIANQVMKEGEIEEATLLPVFLCIRKDKM